jgi:hypothetical protein
MFSMESLTDLTYSNHFLDIIELNQGGKYARTRKKDR